MTPLKLYLIAGAAALAIATAGGGALYVRHLQHDLAAASARANAEAAALTVASGQISASADAATIADRGAQRGARLAAIHEDHAHDLQSAPGAGQPLDPGFVQRLNDRLCDYDAYAGDPGCAGLRGRDPAQLPGAGQADAPA